LAGAPADDEVVVGSAGAIVRFRRYAVEFKQGE